MRQGTVPVKTVIGEQRRSHFDVELAGDDIEGLAIRVDTGDVVVSRSIRDLVVGSGLSFHERGLHALKVVPDK